MMNRKTLLWDIEMNLSEVFISLTKDHNEPYLKTIFNGLADSLRRYKQHIKINEETADFFEPVFSFARSPARDFTGIHASHVLSYVIHQLRVWVLEEGRQLFRPHPLSLHLNRP